MRWGWMFAFMGVACSGSEPARDSAPVDEPALTICEDGLPPRPFDTDPGGLMFGEQAGDFSAETLDGETFRLSEAWNGCDSFVIVSYFEGGDGDLLWSSDPGALLANAPSNSQFIFVSDEGGKARRRNRVEAMRDALRLRGRRAERVHFLVDRLSRIEGNLGDVVSDYLDYLPQSLVRIDGDRSSLAPLPYFLGIDRDQRWDPGGNIDDVVGGNPQVSFAGFLPHFYNHKATLAHRLATDGATEVELLHKRMLNRSIDVTAELPADLSGFDSLEFDIEVTCNERNPFACSEWDRIARIDWCADETCAERLEIVRWITPYWRRGTRRWAVDASPFLALLEGGEQTFRVTMGPSWERRTLRVLRLKARFGSRGGPRPVRAARVYTGGRCDASYNDDHPPVSIDVPASASRVELVTILSGHGQADGTNCAEWCDHRHRFSVDGEEAVTLRPEGAVGQSLDCAPQAAQGVPPGQWGNWSPLRAYWCPGLPVAPVQTDLTSLVTPGSTAELSYEAFLGADQPPGGGNISLSAYVVYYE